MVAAVGVTLVVIGGALVDWWGHHQRWGIAGALCIGEAEPVVNRSPISVNPFAFSGQLLSFKHMAISLTESEAKRNSTDQLCTCDVTRTGTGTTSSFDSEEDLL